MGRKYGWVRDLPDQRDKRVSYRRLGASALPSAVDLRGMCPPVYDQGELGSCTANAIAAAYEFDAARQGLPAVVPSRLLIYYNERALEGTTQSDAGAQIRDGIKVLAQYGVCPESEWPYDVSQFAVQPPQRCYTDAAQHLAIRYEALTQDVSELKASLAAGNPFVFGFTVYSSFESDQVAQSGIVPMPHWLERALGGHAVLCVGYNDQTGYFTVRNSWGPGWGDGGYCYMPYQYLSSNLASDFWTIEQVN